MTDSIKKGSLRPEETDKRNADATLGLDQDEQMMNGMYGMAETKEEDQLPSKIKETY
jgi:hypothetical protein